MIRPSLCAGVRDPVKVKADKRAHRTISFSFQRSLNSQTCACATRRRPQVFEATGGVSLLMPAFQVQAGSVSSRRRRGASMGIRFRP